MNQIKLLLLILVSTCLLYACSGNSSPSAAKESTSNNTTSTNNDSTYYGNNSLAYSINGRHVAIKDQLKYGEGKYIQAFFVNEVKNHADDGMIKIEFTNLFTHEVFNFFISNKGTTTVHKDQASVANALNNKAAKATYLGTNYINYYGESAVIAITSIDDKHVAGTFSGKFLSDDDKPVSIEIMDGKFDVAFTKEKENQ